MSSDPTWLVSAYDSQEHGFDDPDAINFLVALCSHSLPRAKALKPEKSPFRRGRCITCLLIHGDLLAERHGDTRWGE